MLGDYVVEGFPTPSDTGASQREEDYRSLAWYSAPQQLDKNGASSGEHLAIVQCTLCRWLSVALNIKGDIVFAATRVPPVQQKKNNAIAEYGLVCPARAPCEQCCSDRVVDDRMIPTNVAFSYATSAAVVWIGSFCGLLPKQCMCEYLFGIAQQHGLVQQALLLCTHLRHTHRI